MSQHNLMTKIICTIGPASREPKILGQLIQGGMNVARLNFSHGDPQEHLQTLKDIRKLSAECGKTVAVLLDLPGPKLRVGKFSSPSVQLNPGQKFTLTAREVMGDNRIVSANYPVLPQEVKPGDIILLRDGLIGLQVLSIQDQDILCLVTNGGELSEHQGINLPGVDLHLPAITPADVDYLALGLAWGVDLIAMSFVRAPEEVLQLKKLISDAGHNIPVIAKLEKPQAIARLDAIIRAADGVMVARGDLGIEMPVEQVPILQKKIINQANQLGKVVITATQMLESMIRSPRPTRAEASDVANSILDGTDAVMLSGETAAGQYPVQALYTMVNIIRATEQAEWEAGECKGKRLHPELQIADAVCRSAALAAAQVQAQAIAAFTQSGYTARLISKYRPAMPIIAFTPSVPVQRQMAIYWGTEPLVMDYKNDLQDLIADATQVLKRQGRVKPGDKLVFLLGLPLAQAGVTNMMKVHEVV